MNAKGFDLTGKVAVVTGTSRGLGQYFGRALAKAGADLVITSRDPATLKPFQQEIEALGRKAFPLALDVRDYGSIQRMAGAAVAGIEQFTIACSTLRGGSPRPPRSQGWVTRLKTRRVRRPAAQHPLQPSVKCSKPFLFPIPDSRFPVPAFTRGYAGLAPYGASRGGVKQLTMSLADDWGVHGITVNCLAPGWFKTAQNAVMYENEEWLAYLCDRIPLKRPGKPADLDGAVVFLASDASEYVTGQTLLVDGGISTGATKATLKKA